MKKINLRTWLFINLALAFLIVITGLSLSFYETLEDAIDNRTLSQLTSVQSLKRAQIRNYLHQQINLIKGTPEFEDALPETINSFLTEYQQPAEFVLTDFEISCLKEKIRTAGDTLILDITSCHKKRKTTLIGVIKGDAFIQLKLIPIQPIQKILLERSGMGQTGESYLVNGDTLLRTISRFFPDSLPSTIKVSTVGVVDGLKGNSGTGIFPDYRNVTVYSSYNNLDIRGLDWVILSEIDYAEGHLPIKKFKDRIVYLSILFFLLCLGLSVFLAFSLSRHLLQVTSLVGKMTLGHYEMETIKPSRISELKRLQDQILRLRNSIIQAIDFLSKIGKMDLNASYEAMDEKDALGLALLETKEKLEDYRALQVNNQKLRTKALYEGQEKEKVRLARELHDSIGPLLTTIKFKFSDLPEESNANRIQEIKGLLDHTIEEVRTISHSLSPVVLIDFGLSSAIKKLFDTLSGISHLKINTSIDNLNQDTLSFDTSIHLYRILQELINNTLKHSQAKNIWFSLTRFEDRLSLFYQDDGVGFEIDKEYQGMGLKNLDERLSVINADYHKRSKPGKGFKIEIDVPIERKK
jgi:signal transduction histidine kinase